MSDLGETYSDTCFETSQLNFYHLSHRGKSHSDPILGWITTFPISPGYTLIIHNPFREHLPESKSAQCLLQSLSSGVYPTTCFRLVLTTKHPQDTPNCGSCRISQAPPGPVIPDMLPLPTAGTLGWLWGGRSKDHHIRQIPVKAKLQGEWISSRKLEELWENHYTVSPFFS